MIESEHLHAQLTWVTLNWMYNKIPSILRVAYSNPCEWMRYFVANLSVPHWWHPHIRSMWSHLHRSRLHHLFNNKKWTVRRYKSLWCCQHLSYICPANLPLFRGHESSVRHHDWLLLVKTSDELYSDHRPFLLVFPSKTDGYAHFFSIFAVLRCVEYFWSELVRGRQSTMKPPAWNVIRIGASICILTVAPRKMSVITDFWEKHNLNIWSNANFQNLFEVAWNII